MYSPFWFCHSTASRSLFANASGRIWFYHCIVYELILCWRLLSIPALDEQSLPLRTGQCSLPNRVVIQRLHSQTHYYSPFEGCYEIAPAVPWGRDGN